MSAAAIAVSGLNKHFGARRLLDIGELTIADGAGYLLTGANGSGKTTLLRILAGLESATVREFAYRGEPTRLMPYPGRLRRAVVYVHQHPYLFHTSLRHNIGYGLRCRGLPAAERTRRIEDAIAWAGLAVHVDTPPAKLSGGERQRAALARARALSPEIWLLDEPTANLDRDGRAQTLALLVQLRSENRTVVIACHDREVIGLPGYSRWHLEDGRIEAA